MIVSLKPHELAELNKFNTARSGGFQNFFRTLQARARLGEGELELTFSDRERIARYAFEYGNGGWENRLKAIFGRSLGPNLGRETLPPAPQQADLL